MPSLSRRELLTAAAVAKAMAARPKGYLVDSLHLFSDDQLRFPYHRNATYRPPPKIPVTGFRLPPSIEVLVFDPIDPKTPARIEELVQTDKRKQSVLDLIPLAGTGRVVTDGDR